MAQILSVGLMRTERLGELPLGQNTRFEMRELEGKYVAHMSHQRERSKYFLRFTFFTKEVVRHACSVPARCPCVERSPSTFDTASLGSSEPSKLLFLSLDELNCPSFPPCFLTLCHVPWAKYLPSGSWPGAHPKFFQPSPARRG